MSRKRDDAIGTTTIGTVQLCTIRSQTPTKVEMVTPFPFVWRMHHAGAKCCAGSDSGLVFWEKHKNRCVAMSRLVSRDQSCEACSSGSSSIITVGDPELDTARHGTKQPRCQPRSVRFGSCVQSTAAKHQVQVGYLGQ